MIYRFVAAQKFDSNWDLVLAASDTHVDLYDFAEQLAQRVPETETAVHSSTQILLSAWDEVVVRATHHNGQPWLNLTTTWNFDGTHGLPIYLPLGADHWMRAYYRSAELAWAQDTQWDEFLHNGWYGGQPPPPLPAWPVAAGRAGRDHEP